jgi:hypothetical protein
MPVRNHGEDKHAWFRVISIGVNPVIAIPEGAALLGAEKYMMKVRYGWDGKVVNYGLFPDNYNEIRDIVTVAVESGDVYWVDLDFDRPGGYPRNLGETVPTRLVDAIRNGQTVPADQFAVTPSATG